MTRSTNMRWVVAMLTAGCLTLTGHEAVAKRQPRSSYSARVNGTTLKVRKGLLLRQYSTALMTISGNMKPSPRKGQRALAISCLIDLKSVVFPTTLDCAASLEEVYPRDPSKYKTWSSFGIQTTFQSLDGARVTGTFRGSIAPVLGATEPATVEDGKFSVVLSGF